MPGSPADVALDWSLDPAAALGVAAAGGAYVAGVARLRRRRRSWPPGRSGAFAAGLLVLVVATQSGLATHDDAVFSVHVVQHLLLGMAAPLLLALAAPVTLALQAVDRPTQVALVRLLHSRPAAAVSHPVVAWLVFGASLPLLYFTPLFAASLRSDLLHAAVHLHFVVAGCLFFWPLVGLDPLRWRVPHGARALLLLLAVPFHAVLGMSLLAAPDLLAGGWYARSAPAWLASPLDDQRTGAGILWAAGDLLGVVAAGVVAVQWMRHDDAEAAREDRRLDAAAAACAAPARAAPGGG